MLSLIKFKMVSCEKGNSKSPLFLHTLSKRLFFALALFLLAAVSTLAQSIITVSVSPNSGGLTVGQTLTTLTATVTNDSQNKGVTWSATGGSFSPTATASGAPTTYTAPATAGVYTLTATSVSDVTRSVSITIGVTDLAGVFTYHNNLSRDGSNPREYAITPSNVTNTTFGKLFSCTVDGAIYAQALWVANLTVGGVKRNVAFVATQHESLYAFDADVNTTPCTPLWQANLIDAAHGGSSSETSVPSGTTGNLVGAGFGDITPEVGVTGTPVIDPSTNTLYVVSKSVIASGLTFYQRLHAIDLTTGNEKSGSPVTIAGTYPGTGDGGTTVAFNARQENQRPGLALVNGIVYIAWASHEDKAPYYGWVMGYNASNLTQASILNVTPNVHYGGIWMSGGAPAADSSNNLYLTTGNGIFDATNTSGPTNDYGDSFLKLTGSLSVSQYFTPSSQASLNANDQDFGAGGAAILVDQLSGPVPHLVIGGGKDGYLYLLNRDAMGGLGDANASQRFNFGNPILSTGAFWNNTFYMAGLNGKLQAFSFNTSTGKFNPSNVSQSSATYGFGSTPSVSSSGTTNGIVWALDNQKYCTSQSASCGAAVLHAYDSTNLATELWNSTLGTGNTAGNAVKFTVPTVANGKVYVGTRGNNTGGTTSSTTIPGELDVYGLLNGSTTPFAPILVHSGGAAYTDSLAQVWSADKNFTGGSSSSTTHAIASTSDPTLYQSERYGNFTYQFTVPNGSYNITLKFAEIYWTSAGKRIFNVAINGTPVLSNFDIFAAAGSSFTAIDKTFQTVVSTGAITIQFSSGSADLPKVSAIGITTYSGVLVQVSPTTASLYASQQQQFTSDVTGSTNAGVTWTYSPQVGTLTASGLYTAPASVTTAQTVSVTATSQADSTKSAVATVSLLPPAGAFSPIFVHSGGGAYTDSLGNNWSADTGFAGGAVSSTTKAIANTPDPALYQTNRHGVFSYQFSVPPGNYSVILKFAETYFTSAGKRVFNASINGTQVLTNFDIVANAGAPLTAVDQSFPVTVTGSSITIQFSSGSVDLPMVNAIAVKAASGVGIQINPTSASLSASQSQQFGATVTGTTNLGVTWTYSPQVGTLGTSGPTAGLYTAPASITTAQTVRVTAASVADPMQASSATVSLLPPFTPILVHSGGAAYTDTLAQVWSADAGFSGGNTASTASNIANTPDPKLYQTERYGNFTYQFTVPNGGYNVTLKFAEFYFTSAGRRIFNVAINGTPVLTNFDIIAAAGAALTAIDKTFPVTVTNGQVTIQFTSGSADLPKVSAIQIR